MADKKRQGFIPRKNEDFGDGDAFPEIHLASIQLAWAVRMRSLGRKSFPSLLTPGAILLLMPLSIRMRMHQSLFAHSTKTPFRKSYQKKRKYKYRKSWRRRFRKPLTVTKAALEKIVNAQPKNVPTSYSVF